MSETGVDAPRDVIFIGALPPPVNGLSNMNAATIDALGQAGHRVTTRSLSPTPDARGLEYHLSRLRSVLGALVTSVYRRRKIDLAYLPVDGGLGLIYGILFAASFRFLRKPIVAHHHSFSYIDRPSLLMRRYLAWGPSRQVHVFLCEDMRSAFERRYRDQAPRGYRSVVLPNAFSLSSAPTAHRRRGRDAELVIGHLSNLGVDKGTDLFLGVFEALTAAGVPVSARLAGPVADASLKAKIAAVQDRHPEQFEYVGPVFGGQKTAFLNSLDFFVLPSRNEAQPLVLLEALSSGCILVAIARGCIACDHAASGGLLVRSPEAFVGDAATWIGAMSGAPALLEQLRARAFAHADRLLRSGAAARARWENVINGHAVDSAVLL